MLDNSTPEVVFGGIESLIEVDILDPQNFLKIKETLTRIGIASRKDKKLWQSCNILHKKGKYYITHFKEMFGLDGRAITLSEEDILRRNCIAFLLSDWGLLKVIDESKVAKRSPMSSIKVLSFSEKSEWELISKYKIGIKK
jgi:hypothetical protein